MSNKIMTASTSVRIRVDDVKVFGPGVAELLERIDRCESIRTATMEMKIAYSKAWTMLRSCEADCKAYAKEHLAEIFPEAAE